MTSRFFSVLSFAALIVIAASLAPAETYKVDPVHSMVVFRINHMNISNVLGRFDAPEGTFVTDQDPGKMSFDVSVALDKIDTGNAKRDAHLKSGDFFDAKQFPEIHFKSTSVKKAADNAYEVTGDLTLHGVTKSITITLNKVGEAKLPPPMGQRAGFDGTFTVKRSDFGMTGMQGMIGEDVTLMVNFEGAQS